MTNLNDEFEKEINKTADWVTKSLYAEDPLGVVIRGHLYVESRLIQLIEQALPEPGAIDLTRLNFSTKMDLAVALGLLSEGDKRPYAALNALRNRVAHNAEIEIDEADERQLQKALTAQQRDAQKNHEGRFSGKPFPILRASVLALVTHSLGKLLRERINRAFNPTPEAEAAAAELALEQPRPARNRS
jgi:hypothetical protein